MLFIVPIPLHVPFHDPRFEGVGFFRNVVSGDTFGGIFHKLDFPQFSEFFCKFNHLFDEKMSRSHHDEDTGFENSDLIEAMGMRGWQRLSFHFSGEIGISAFVPFFNVSFVKNLTNEEDVARMQ